MKYHLPLCGLLCLALLMTGCGGGAAGLIGLAIKDATDNSGGVTVANVTITGAAEVPAAAASSLQVARSFARSTDPVQLYGSSDGVNFSRLADSALVAGKYSFTGTYRDYYLKIRHVPTGYDMYIGRVADNATGTLTVPITFDTSAVILTKVMEVQGIPAYIVCGDSLLTTLKTSAETAAKATVNADLKTALAQIIADSTEVNVANLGLDLKVTTVQKLLTAGTFHLGGVTVGEKVWNQQILRLNDGVNNFTFTLYNSETDSVYLNGTFISSTDSVSLTITSLTGFPTDSTVFAGMDAVSEVFTFTGISLRSSDVISGILAGNSVILTKQTVN